MTDPTGSFDAVPRVPSALRRHAAQLLGGSPEDRSTRIMVTLPSQAAVDPGLVADFVQAGMDVARINSAHDDADAWAAMAARVRAASPGVPIAVDLAGPKVRTGPLPGGPHVVKLRPERDDSGRVTAPAVFWVVPAGAPTPQLVFDVDRSAPVIPVADADWIAGRRVGQSLRFTDARGRRRRFEVSQRHGEAVLVAGDRTAYLEEGAVLASGGELTRVAALPAVPGRFLIRTGDTVILTRELHGATSDGGVHRLGCTLPEALDAIRVGDEVFFDDGRIEGVVREVLQPGTAGAEARIEITLAAEGGSRLRAEKGINLPDTELPVSALTAEDLAALDAVLEWADIVQLSFVRTPGDVARLVEELDARGAERTGVVVKLETTQGFRALPEILLELLRREQVGLMIARGDLAVEAGFERLAEVQEEILWLCEAAHVPAIWATQVLDGLAASGIPTRAEVTDAAAGQRAECVMLNKGPHITQAIRALDDILRRMEGHHDKKRPLLRRLKAWSAEQH